MIAANELRIGNWVYDDSKSIQVTTSLFYLMHEYEDRFDLYYDIQPILLTEDILLKAAFIESYRSEYIVKLEHSEYTSFEWKMEKLENQFCIWYKNISIPNIIYLHQLQNLYFALTGKELEVKL